MIQRLQVTLLMCFLNGMLSGCTAAPPSSAVVTHDPTLGRSEGVALLVDVCLQRDGIGGDYFMIGESQTGAVVSQQQLQGYLHDSGIIIREQATLICGARHGDATLIPAADSIGEAVTEQRQPLAVDSQLATDKEYIDALVVISSYAFERAAADEADAGQRISESMFRDAGGIVRNRSNAGSILFLGALGTSRTGALNTVSGIGRFIVGMGTGLATAGLGGDYYAVFMPGSKISGRLYEGALIDLESGKLAWSNAVTVPGNPAKAGNWESDQPLDLLFHDLLFQPQGQKLLKTTKQE